MNIGSRGRATQGQHIAQPSAPTDQSRNVVSAGPPPVSAPVSALDGDVQGDALQNLVAKIQGVTAPAPASPGDDQKFVKYDDASGAFVMAAPTTTLAGDVSGASGANTVDKVGGKVVDVPSGTGAVATYNGTKVVWSVPATTGPSSLLGGACDSITVSSGVTGTQMNQPGEATGHPYGLTMFRAGSILGLSIDLTGSVSAGAGTYTAQIYKDTGSGFVAVGGTSVSVTGLNTHNYLDLGGSPVAFNAGDRLCVFHSRTGSGVAAVASMVTIWVQF